MNKLKDIYQTTLSKSKQLSAQGSIPSFIASLKNFPAYAQQQFPAVKKYATSTQGIISGAVSVIIIMAIVMVIQSCTPRKGTILYGVCKSFLEMQVTFPETIEYDFVEQYRKAVRIYFTHNDSFGEYRVEFIECSFTQHPEKGIQLEKVVFNNIKESTEKNRVPNRGKLYAVKQEIIDLFNQSESSEAILLNNPDLTLPE